MARTDNSGQGGGGGFGGGGGGDTAGEDGKVTGRLSAVRRDSAPQGRLSLSVDLLPAPDSTQKVFRDRSTGGGADAAELDLLYENRSAGAAYRFAIAAAVVCLMWFARKADRSLRVLLAVLGIIVPLALIPVVPVSWHIWLDGLFLGALGGLVVWLGCYVCCSFSEKCAAIGTSRAAQISTLIAITFFATNEPASAAEPPAARAPNQRVTRPNAPAVEQNADVEVAKPQPESHTVDIVVPYDRNTDPLLSDRVHVPHKTFLKLWNQAYPEKRIGGAAALKGAVSGAIYEAELQPAAGESRPRVAIKGRIILTSFRDHQITLTLPLRDIAVRSAKLDGEAAALVVPKPGSKVPLPLSVVVEKAGTHLLDLEFDVPAESTGPAGRFALSLFPVAAGRLTFTIPAPNLTARVNGSTSAFRVKKSENREQIELPVDAGGDLSVSWQPKEERGGVATTIHAEGTTLVAVQDSGVRFTHSFLFRARQGSIAEVLFDLPPELQLQRLQGADVGGWEIAGEGNARKLKVFLRRSVTDETRITAQTYQALKIGDDPVSLSLPAVAPSGVTRETGTVALYAGPQLRVQGTTETGAARINAAEFAPPKELELPSGRIQLVYRYAARPIQLQWQVTREKPDLTATAEHGVLIERRKQRVTSRFEVKLSGVPRSRLSFALPPNYLPLDVNSDGMNDWFLAGEGEAKTLVIEFDQPRTGTTRAQLSGTIAKEIGDETSDVILPTLQGASRLDSTVSVWIDSSYAATLTDPPGWKGARPEEMSDLVQKLQPKPAQFAFRSSELQPGPITINLAKVTPRLMADALTLVTVTETAVHHTLAMKWRIVQGAADTFLFTTPDWLSGKLEFSDKRIRQVEETKLPGGMIRWKLTLEEPLRDEFVLTALAVLPTPSGPEVLGPRLHFEEPTSEQEGGVRRIAAQRQYVAIVNHSEAQLSPAAAGTLEAVDAKDLPIRIGDDLIRQTMEIGAARNDQAPRWSRQRLVRQGSAPASVNLADLLTVVEKDGTYRTRVSYRIKNRARQFLALRLPADSRLLSVFVAGQPARPVTTTRNEQTYNLIALPKTSDAGLSFVVEAVVSGQLPSGEFSDRFRVARQDLNLPVPEVVTPQEDEEFGIPVARTRWTVYFPKDQDVEIIEDPRQTNLSELATGSESLVDLDATLAEAGALLAVLKDTGSSRARYEAYDNLKRFELELSKDSSSDYISSGEGEQLAQKRRDILSEIKSNEGRIQIDVKGKRALKSNNEKFDEDFDFSAQSRQADEITAGNRMAPPQTEGDGVQDLFEFKQEFDAPKPAEKSGKESELGVGAKKELSERRQRGSQQIELNRQLEEQGRPRDSKNNSTPSDAPKPENEGVPAEDGQKPQSNMQAPARGRSMTLIRKRANDSNNGDKNAGPESGEMAKQFDKRKAENRPLARHENAFWGALDEVEEAAIAHAPNQKAPAAGALSLKVQIPVPADSRKFVLSKPGGSPRLAVAVRPKASLVTGLSFLWTLAWLLLAAVIIAAWGTRNADPKYRRHLPKIAVAVGLVAALLLPTPINWLGVLVVVISIAVALRRPAAAT